MIKSARGIVEVPVRLLFTCRSTYDCNFASTFASKFLDDLEQKLKPVGLQERQVLLAMKKKEHDERGLPFDGEFYLWDYRYYDRKYIEASLDLDDMLVKEYFPVSTVVPTILGIYQNLLGVRFEEIKGETWHPGASILSRLSTMVTVHLVCSEAQHFAVWEHDAKDESGFVGYCYLDLYPRGLYSSVLSSYSFPTLMPNCTF